MVIDTTGPQVESDNSYGERTVVLFLLQVDEVFSGQD